MGNTREVFYHFISTTLLDRSPATPAFAQAEGHGTIVSLFVLFVQLLPLKVAWRVDSRQRGAEISTLLMQFSIVLNLELIALLGAVGMR
jgi:hypothetical protein